MAGIELMKTGGTKFLVLAFMAFFSLAQISPAQEVNVSKEGNTEDVVVEQAKSTETMDTVLLKDIVVTATRTEKEITEAPGSISVVTNEDIEKRDIQTVDQALNTLPGVYTTRTKLMDISPTITLRGMPGALGRTLVMKDGINLVDPMLGNLYGFAGMAPEEIEKIEVVKGPFSSLYGGQAMGGVVNIITKMPDKREFVVQSGYGSSWDRGEALDDLRKFYVSCGDKVMDKLSMFLSYGVQKTGGFPTIYNVQGTQPPADISGSSYTTDPMGNPRYWIGDKGDTTFWDNNVALKAAYDFSEISKIKLSYNTARFETHYDDPHTNLKDAAGNPVYSYGAVPEASFLNYDDMYREQDFYNMSYETEIATVKSKLSMSYVDSNFGAGIPGSTSTIAGGSGTEWDNPEDSYYNAELLLTTPLSENQLVTFGGFYGHNQGQMDEYNRTNWKDEDTRTDLTYRAKGRDRTYSLFAQDEIMILDNLTAYAGLRQDWWQTFDGSVYQLNPSTSINYGSNTESSISPKVSLVYQVLEGTTLRTSAGKAFRAPTIVELYRTWTSPTGGITYAGNSNLKPETTKSWDIGAEQALWKGSKIKGAYFENDMKDFIQRQMVTSTLFQNENVAKAESKGVELEAEQRFDNWLRVFANFTYTDSKVKENAANPKSVGESLTMLPDKLFNIGTDLTKGPFSVGIVGRYVSKAYKNDDNSDDKDNVYGSYDPYFVADAKASYDITKMATLSLSVDNILNEDYFYSDKAPGRSWFSELTIKF